MWALELSDKIVQRRKGGLSRLQLTNTCRFTACGTGSSHSTSKIALLPLSQPIDPTISAHFGRVSDQLIGPVSGAVISPVIGKLIYCHVCPPI